MNARWIFKGGQMQFTVGIFFCDERDLHGDLGLSDLTLGLFM